MKKRIVNFMLVVALIATLFGLTACKGDDQKEASSNKDVENVIKSFYDNYYTENVEAAMKLMDFAGMEVYNELGEDLSDFKKQYDEYVASEEWNQYKSQIDESWSTMVDNLKAMMSSIEVPKLELSNYRVENVSTDLYKVVVNLKQTSSEGEENAQDFTHYVFKTDDGYKLVFVEGQQL